MGTISKPQLENEPIAPRGRLRFAKFWRLLQMLLLAILIVASVLWLNGQQSQRDLAVSRQQHDTALAIAADQQRATALTNYINNISTMLVQNNLLQAHSTDVMKTVAQAQTLDILRKLDPDRKAALLRFLYETKLINNDYHIISLADADVTNAHLNNIDLRDTYLVGANLSGADLRNANLSYGSLFFANFSGANLAGADLHSSDMHNVNLAGANLAGANLKDATGISSAQLAKAGSLSKTTLPDGSVHA